MRSHGRAVAEARLKILHAEVLRGMALAAMRRAEEVREEGVATRAAIAQRRLAESRVGWRFPLTSPDRRRAAPR
jgi:hypothetical protein